MGFIFTVLTLPYAPVRGVTALARVLQRDAQNQLYSHAGVRRQLEELDAAVADGRISQDERAQQEQVILDRLMD
jgi:hypothetical protein